MPQYEINVWREVELLSKEVTYFENDESCAAYVNDKYNAPDSWTQSVTELRWRPQRGIRVTWGKLPQYNYKPKKMLSAEDHALQKQLDDSITEENIKEFEDNLFKDMTRKDYYGNPDAKGYEEKK
jgi:hypothetical protein